MHSFSFNRVYLVLSITWCAFVLAHPHGVEATLHNTLLFNHLESPLLMNVVFIGLPVAFGYGVVFVIRDFVNWIAAGH